MGNRPKRRTNNKSSKEDVEASPNLTMEPQTEYSKLLFHIDKLNNKQDASLGSMLGAFVGDSLGSFLEFKTGKQRPEMVQLAMMMPGGGPHGVKPGQVTDDSELAMCQLRGLLAGNGKFDPYHVALYYGHWIQKGPFDIGQTTRTGLGPLAECLENPDPKLAQQAAAGGSCSKSLSNGSAMRATPIAVWAQNLGTVEELEAVVKEDVSMMHARKAMWDIVTVYCLAIGTLIRCAGQSDRAQKALKAVEDYGKREGVTYYIAEFVQEARTAVEKQKAKLETDPESEDFFFLETINVQAQMGYVRHAIVLSIYFLLRSADKDSSDLEEFYNWAMKQTVLLAGDSDTNCAIVGGVVGAYVGVRAIDRAKLKKVLECQIQSEQGWGVRCRAKFIQPGQSCIDEMLKLTKIAPKKLEVVPQYISQELTIE